MKNANSMIIVQRKEKCSNDLKKNKICEDCMFDIFFEYETFSLLLYF